MVEFLPFYFFLFVTFPTFQCRYVYQYQKKNILLPNSKNRPFNDIEAKATYQNSPRNRINKKTGSMIKNQ